MPGTLYLVATPIGNISDVTQRALETLRRVDVIACEDTRHTRKLLTHFEISNRTISYHEHNEHARVDELAERLERGESVAVVSDAGTPGISDPGFSIVNRAIEIGARIVPIPGPVAFVTAAVASGLPTGSLFFGGFLPAKKTERRRRLQAVADMPATLVFYESPRRLSRALDDCLEILGDRRAAVARELTKLHEEIVRGRISEIVAGFLNADVRGEIVLVIGQPDAAAKKSPADMSLVARVAELENSGVDHKTALKTAAKEFGLHRSEAYRRLLEERNLSRDIT
jgi:16S rRNA (cytidine1402-2'-O)-methyltransferase